MTKSASAVLRLPADCAWQVLVLQEVRLVVGAMGASQFDNVGGIAYQGRAVMDQYVGARASRAVIKLPDFVASSIITGLGVIWI